MIERVNWDARHALNRGTYTSIHLTHLFQDGERVREREECDSIKVVRLGFLSSERLQLSKLIIPQSSKHNILVTLIMLAFHALEQSEI